MLYIHVIRGVEAHKAAVAFMYYARGWEGSVPGGRRAGGHRGWLSNGRTGWCALGLTSGLVGVGVSHLPTV